MSFSSAPLPARLVWASSSLSFLYFPTASDSIYENLAQGLPLGDKKSEEIMCRLKDWPWILWRVWKARNYLCFNNHTPEVQDLLGLVKRDRMIGNMLTEKLHRTAEMHHILINKCHGKLHHKVP